MHGRLSHVIEIVAHDDSRRTFRAMYLVKLRGTVYVLHVFNKKASHGTKTPQQDLNVVELRMKAAQRHYEEHHGKSKTN